MRGGHERSPRFFSPALGTFLTYCEDCGAEKIETEKKPHNWKEYSWKDCEKVNDGQHVIKKYGFIKLEVVFRHLFFVHIKCINSIKGGIGIAYPDAL